jgi:predicted permease
VKLWRRKRPLGDFDDEIRSHLEMESEELTEEGLRTEEAPYVARRAFGNVTVIRERAYEGSRWLLWDYLKQDVRYAVRGLWRNRGYTAAVIATLALGIGTNAAIFSVVNAVLLRQLPLPDADRLAVVWKGPIAGVPERGIAPANAIELVDRARGFESIAPFTNAQFVIRQDVGAERVPAMRVASTFFRTLGISPAIGRDFLPSDDLSGAERVAIISDALWQRRFGGDPRVIGSSIPVGSVPMVIIGVMPAGFRFPEIFGTNVPPDIWTPLAFGAGEGTARGAGYMFLLLKRQPQWSWDDVRRELDAFARLYATLEPQTYANQRLVAIPLHERVVGASRSLLLFLWAAGGLVLVIACANAANVLLSRALARSKELAVRASLGASRRRLLRQLLTESFVMVGLAATIGLALATVAVHVARDTLGEILPRAHEIAIDWRVVALTLAAATLTSLAVGVLPALQLAAVSPGDVLRRVAARGSTESRWSAGVRRVLLVGQITVAVLLVTGAGLLSRSFAAVHRVDLGLQPDALLTFELSLEGRRPAAAVAAFYDQLTERLQLLPRVASVGALNLLPLSGSNFGWTFLVADKPVPLGTTLPIADVRIVTPRALETLGVPIRRGRSFFRTDHADAQPVAVVNETLARNAWPGEDPIGKQIKLEGPVKVLPWMTIVGLAADVRFGALDRGAAPAIYRPHSQHSWSSMAVVIRTPDGPAAIAPAVRETVRRLDPDAVVINVRPFTFYLARSVAERRVVTTVVSLFAGIAFALALVGVYGLFTYAVASRTREFGVHIALGATRADVIWMTMRPALLLGGLGVIAGAMSILAARRLIETQLFGVEATDPATLSVISLSVLCTALLASYLPARRAADIDPTAALRAE